MCAYLATDPFTQKCHRTTELTVMRYTYLVVCMTTVHSLGNRVAIAGIRETTAWQPRGNRTGQPRDDRETTAQDNRQDNRAGQQQDQPRDSHRTITGRTSEQSSDNYGRIPVQPPGQLRNIPGATAGAGGSNLTGIFLMWGRISLAFA